MSYPAPPPASPPPASSGQSAPSASSFFSDLFDIRFTRFVSLRLISIVYILILVVVSLVALAAIFTGFAIGPGTGIFYLILAALLWVVYIVLARVGLEAFAVLFRIHDDTNRIADALAGSRAPASTGTVTNVDPGYGATQAYPAPPATPPADRPGTPPADPSSPPWT